MIGKRNKQKFKNLIKLTFMQNFNKNLILFCLVMLSYSAFSQRYLTEIFDDVQVTSDVTYGQNATLLFIAQVGGPVKQDLKMDVYEPMNDDNTERPLVLLLHTGNFLPRIVNGGIQGTKSDSSAVEIATRLAKMGYVVASVDYRLGWNPGAPTQPLRALGLIQAAYRGIQDARTAVRFFRNDAANADLYKIDSERVMVWGNGTGGYIGLGMATLDNYNEILTTTSPSGKFFFDNDGDPTTADIPMVVENFHGDIEGKVEVIAPADGFGYTAGDTSSFSNWPDESSDIQLVLNVGGALGDISWLDENSAPVISFHHHLDPFAPYESAVLRVPGTNDLIVEVQGSRAIAEKQNDLGNNQPFIDANINDAWTTAAMNNSTIAGHDYFEALSPSVDPANVLGTVEGVVIDWWDPNAIPPDASNPMGLPWNELPNLLADPAGTITFDQSAQATNIGQGPLKAKTNIDSLIGFFAPRAFSVLDLATGTNNISAEEVAMEIAPNPTSTIFNITSNVDSPIQQVRIFDLNGRLVRQYDAVNENKLTVDRNNLASGMHIVMVTFEEGVVSKKVLIN